MDRNSIGRQCDLVRRSRSLTGAWIETSVCTTGCGLCVSLPHGGVDRNTKRRYGVFRAGSSLPHGGVDRNPICRGATQSCGQVAPSRGRGSKPAHRQARAAGPPSLPHGGVDRNLGYPDPAAHLRESLPHGGVDRNGAFAADAGVDRGRSLTGAWIETRTRRAPGPGAIVAPSRGRGSKPLAGPLSPRGEYGGRSLTGAWIETATSADMRSSNRSLPHGGVDRNAVMTPAAMLLAVAPSRGRGSKPTNGRPIAAHDTSLPHGGVDRNPDQNNSPPIGVTSLPHGGADRNRRESPISRTSSGRSLTGAWIETLRTCTRTTSRPVAPSRGRRSKPLVDHGLRPVAASLPHGGVDRNAVVGRKLATEPSLPHGGVDRNQHIRLRRVEPGSRSLTGAWIETLPIVATYGEDEGRSLTGASIETLTPRPTAATARSLPHGCRARRGPGETWRSHPSAHPRGARSGARGLPVRCRQRRRSGRRWSFGYRSRGTRMRLAS